MYDSADLSSIFVIGLLLGVVIGASLVLGLLARIASKTIRKED